MSEEGEDWELIRCALELRLNSFANPYLAHREEDESTFDELLRLSTPSLVIGRSSQLSDVVLRHEVISRQHVAVLHADGASYVQDLGTAAGTKLNDARVPPNTPTRLKDGDVISFGEPCKATYTYRVLAAAPKKKPRR